MILVSIACEKLSENVISLYKIELVKQCELCQEMLFGKHVGAAFEYSLN